MPPKQPFSDRNFDGLSRRFKRNIYQSPKGKIRLAVLKRDFEALEALAGASVLDVGAGQGQFASWLAGQGATLCLSDVSGEMLGEAKARFAAQEKERSGEHLNDRFDSYQHRFIQSDLWQLDTQLAGEQFDVVCNHAVLEWLENPFDAVKQLVAWVKPGGYLSLLFYNVHGLMYKNLLRANYQKVLSQDLQAYRGSLTPINPLQPERVIKHVKRFGFDILQYSGVRVFYDYILDPQVRKKSIDEMMALELSLSQQEPYRGLGRYIHILAKCERAC